MTTRVLAMDHAFISVHVDPKDIFFLDILLEGFGHLGVPTTVDRQTGLVVIRSTLDTREEVLQILEHFPRPVKVLETLEVPAE